MPTSRARLVADLDRSADVPFLVIVNDRVISVGSDYERLRNFVRAYNAQDPADVQVLDVVRA